MRQHFFVVILSISSLFSCSEERPNTVASLAETSCGKFSEDIPRLISCLNALPRENIKKIPEIAKFYAEGNEVYVSLTSSPLRLGYLTDVFQTIDFDLVHKVIVALPAKFKNKESYSDDLIEKIKNFDDRVYVHRFDPDLGPISKLIPAVQLANERSIKDNKKRIVITIDDDTAYSIGIFGQLIKTVLLDPDAKVAGTIGQASSNWNLNPKKDIFKNECTVGGRCDLVEGFGAIAYRAEAVPVSELILYSGASQTCKLSDDLVINYGLARKGINRYKIQNDYAAGVVQLDYGFRADALHNQNTYSRSYQQCIEDIEARDDSLQPSPPQRFP